MSERETAIGTIPFSRKTRIASIRESQSDGSGAPYCSNRSVCTYNPSQNPRTGTAYTLPSGSRSTSSSGRRRSGYASLISARETTRGRIGTESAPAAKKNRISGSAPAAKSFRMAVFHASSLVDELSATVFPLSDS